MAFNNRICEVENSNSASVILGADFFIVKLGVSKKILKVSDWSRECQLVAYFKLFPIHRLFVSTYILVKEVYFHVSNKQEFISYEEALPFMGWNDSILAPIRVEYKTSFDSY